MEQIQRIPLAQIRESVVTLRTEYDEDELRELGGSLNDDGQIQTIVVQPGDNDCYDLIIGSRRVRAAKLKGLKDIAAYVIEKRSPVDLLFIALAENLHRVDLNPFEEARAFLRLMREYKLDVKTIAKRVNKPVGYVGGRLKLLSMPEEVATLVSEGKLGLTRVGPLARLPSGEDQVRLAQSAVQNRLTASELAAQVQHELDEPARPERASHELTAVKVQARLDEFTGFLEKVPRRINVSHMNAAEKQGVLKSLLALESQVRSLRDTIRGAQSTASDTGLTPGYSEPGNNRTEWTTKDIQRINAPGRPSDQVLAVELGRSVAAIRVMRSNTQEKKKA
ncbi:MAG: ParB/RepB/Spo0J family partition protein [Candidatus Magasanikbacteria bacterium]|nr:ParB/RepB/Spo0J family partition protein [Candidatus Magasanikbacteria bacterium]